MEQPLPFALPDVGDAEIEAVTNAIRSGWVSTGPLTRQFEEKFAEALGNGLEAVAVSSATAGLHLALEAIGVGPGDEVLVPTWTFTATAEVVRYLGAEPVLIDVEHESLNVDLDQAAQRVSDRTKAIMPVHFAGRPVDYRKLADFAATNGLEVVEDAAHAFPASSATDRVGGGDSAATVFSFYATKTMTTGEGGMLVTRRPEVARRARTMRLHGISRDAFDRYRSTGSPWRYEVVAPGYKYNLTDPASAMGLVQLRRAESMRLRRESISARYTEAFTGLGLELPTEQADGKHAWHLYVVRCADEATRDCFISGLSARGVGTSVHFIPLHLQPYWRERGGYTPDDFLVASREFGRVVSLPIFSAMTDGQVERVIQAVQEVHGGLCPSE
ncbi:DegT/DnrJ/EryC1/StrS family aminotransferase [Cumulibacter manganitolerans]|uniref:DegT/DnrJ/EryC1/StrS family aminotransferase n=1 Tax=Cumulibacter manganitolerans TaxID=1884992 RepID=UPI001296F82C|nr:DegT/DnrJ/EryC1/StrS family aminotransferase [Cumulibacter manganitolerans]